MMSRQQLSQASGLHRVGARDNLGGRPGRGVGDTNGRKVYPLDSASQTRTRRLEEIMRTEGSFEHPRSTPDPLPRGDRRPASHDQRPQPKPATAARASHRPQTQPQPQQPAKPQVSYRDYMGKLPPRLPDVPMPQLPPSQPLSEAALAEYNRESVYIGTGAGQWPNDGTADGHVGSHSTYGDLKDSFKTGKTRGTVQWVHKDNSGAHRQDGHECQLRKKPMAGMAGAICQDCEALFAPSQHGVFDDLKSNKLPQETFRLAPAPRGRRPMESRGGTARNADSSNNSRTASPAPPVRTARELMITAPESTPKQIEVPASPVSATSSTQTFNYQTILSPPPPPPQQPQTPHSVAESSISSTVSSGVQAAAGGRNSHVRNFSHPNARVSCVRRLNPEVVEPNELNLIRSSEALHERVRPVTMNYSGWEGSEYYFEKKNFPLVAALPGPTSPPSQSTILPQLKETKEEEEVVKDEEQKKEEQPSKKEEPEPKPKPNRAEKTPDKKPSVIDELASDYNDDDDFDDGATYRYSFLTDVSTNSWMARGPSPGLLVKVKQQLEGDDDDSTVLTFDFDNNKEPDIFGRRNGSSSRSNVQAAAAATAVAAAADSSTTTATTTTTAPSSLASPPTATTSISHDPVDRAEQQQLEEKHRLRRLELERKLVGGCRPLAELKRENEALMTKLKQKEPSQKQKHQKQTTNKYPGSFI